MRTRHVVPATHWLGLSLIATLVCACGATLSPGYELSASAVLAADGPAFVQWLPDQSYPGGPHFDARMDKPVRFWRAGLSLKQVFAGVQQQTGVELGFWPPGDENERVRVNLYLNVDRPPVLRELMSQLMWATDCAFALEGGAEPREPYRYYLLSTSVADSAAARLQQDQEAARAALEQQRQSRAPTREQMAASLVEYRQALALTEDELISRYHGVEDRLLATMLDPARRATLSFTLGLGDESISALLNGEQLTLQWQDLTAEQQADLQSCLGSQRRGGRGGPPGAPASGGEPAGSGQRQPTQISVAGLGQGQVVITADTEPSGSQAGARRRFLQAPRLNLTGQGELTPDETIALRRGMGEDLADDQARSLFRDWGRSRQEQMQQQRQERTRQVAEATIAQGLPLSPAVEAELSSFALPIQHGASYALWQVQQAVASATGLNVVSDCFSQPPRQLSSAVRLLYPGESPKITGLQALRVSCLSTQDLSSLARAVSDDYSAGWEWQDAGPFLRFRSRARDLWRAAMLPAETAAWLARWLDPYIEKLTQSNRPATEVDVPLDLQQIGLMAASLSDLQIRHGGALICGDPTAKPDVARGAVRGEVLGAISSVTDTLRALATLSANQWAQLRSTGLRVTYDLTSSQRRAFGLSAPGDEAAAPAPPVQPAPRGGRFGPMVGGRRGAARPGQAGPRGLGAQDPQEMTNLVLTLTDERPGQARGGPLGRNGRGRWQAKESSYLGFRVNDTVRAAYPLPRVLSVGLTMPTELGQPIPLDGP